MQNIQLRRGSRGAERISIKAYRKVWPPMSQCWEQLVHKLRALTATAWSPLVFNPDAETVRMLPSEAPGRVSRNLKFKDTLGSGHWKANTLAVLKRNHWQTGIQLQDAKAGEMWSLLFALVKSLPAMFLNMLTGVVSRLRHVKQAWRYWRSLSECK